MFDLDLIIEDGLGDVRQLLGTLGASFNDANVEPEQQHAALMGALNWIADGADGVGLASARSPAAPAPRSVSVSTASSTSRRASSGTPPLRMPPDDSIEFVEQVGPRASRHGPPPV